MENEKKNQPKEPAKSSDFTGAGNPKKEEKDRLDSLLDAGGSESVK